MNGLEIKWVGRVAIHMNGFEIYVDGLDGLDQFYYPWTELNKLNGSDGLRFVWTGLEFAWTGWTGWTDF